MRYLIAIASLAALTATAASANTRYDMHQAPASLAASSSDLAIKGGQVMGEDPDANVRFELRRDNPTY